MPLFPQAFALQINQKRGLPIFCPTVVRAIPTLLQNLESPSPAQGPHLLADFTRGWSAVEEKRY